MTDKIDKLIAELKLCESKDEQYNILKIFSFRCFAAGRQSVDPQKNPISLLHRCLNLLKLRG